MNYGSPGYPNDFPVKMKPAVVRWVIPGWSFYALQDSPVLVDGRIYYTPIFVEEATTYIRVGVSVTNLRAAATLDLRLFEDDNGGPGALIEDFGNVSLAAVALVEIVIARLLARGSYWLARRTDAAGAGANLAGVNNGWGVKTPTSGVATVLGASAIVNPRCIAPWADPAPAPTELSGPTDCCVYLREN